MPSWALEGLVCAGFGRVGLGGCRWVRYRGRGSGERGVEDIKVGVGNVLDIKVVVLNVDLVNGRFSPGCLHGRSEDRKVVNLTHGHVHVPGRW